MIFFAQALRRPSQVSGRAQAATARSGGKQRIPPILRQPPDSPPSLPRQAEGFVRAEADVPADGGTAPVLRRRGRRREEGRGSVGQELTTRVQKLQDILHSHGSFFFLYFFVFLAKSNVFYTP